MSISEGDGVVPSALETGGVMAGPVLLRDGVVPVTPGGSLLLPELTGVGLVLGYCGVVVEGADV
ncbi:MAG TPA: hypothetical protein VFN91_01865 [Myxococcaceae bacterium]|nr:hypothetical protein [Myxococcaceae bacterium]